MSRRNPNNYGSITKLSGKRSKPWMVRVTIYDEWGTGRQTPIGYAATEEQAKIMLAKYNDNPWNIDRDKVTLADLYKRWSEIKMPKLGQESQKSLKMAYKHLSQYYGVKYRSIRAYQMQEAIDNCGRGYATKGAIKTLWGHLDRFAFELDITDKMYSQLTTSPAAEETTRTPFTREQIDKLWNIVDEPFVDTVLIFIYTGFRLNELLKLKNEDVDMINWCIKSGEKSTAGKGRIVPVHERIRPLVEIRATSGSTYFIPNSRGDKNITISEYYQKWKSVMEKIGADKTPHEARHTFETMLDNAGGNRKCIDMLMGHRSKDVGNRVYNHKTINQLRDTISLLK